MSVQLNSSTMKPRNIQLEEQLINLRDRIPLRQNSCKSEDLTFLSLLYLILMQTFGTMLLFLYTLINFCTIILGLIKFFLGWLINVLQTKSKSAILIKLVIIVVELLVLILIVYKIATVIFLPLISMQLIVANHIVGVDTSEKKEDSLMMDDTEEMPDEGDEMESMQMEDGGEPEDIAEEDELESGEET